MNAADSARLDAYLGRLGVALAELPEAERDEIVLEARSHVLERMSRPDADLDGVLGDLGPADQYAASFLEGRPDAGAKPRAPAPLGPARRALDGAARFAAGFLYGVAAMLGAIALYELIRPDRVGVWRLPATPSGERFRLHFEIGTDVAPAGTDVLGFWLVPLALAAAFVLVVLGRFIRGLGRPAGRGMG